MATLRLEGPGDRPLRCGAYKSRKSNQKKARTVVCEKDAGHGWSCLMTTKQRLHVLGSGDPAGLARMYRAEAKRHAGRDGNGIWRTWEEW